MSLNTTPIRDALGDHAAASGHFDQFVRHEPKNPPGNGLTGSIWVQRVRPVPASSGLRSTCGLVTFWLRIYMNMLSDPQDDIDPTVDAARDHLMGAYSSGFTLGGLIRNVDLLGATGEPLSAQAGYVTIGNQMNRVTTITIPCVVNDCWDQAP